MRFKIPVVFAVLFLAQLSGAAQNLSAQIDEFIRSEMQTRKIPGVSLAVVRDGKIAMLKSYGFHH